jgi:pyrroloquinoline quinone biosynthesis protein E
MNGPLSLIAEITHRCPLHCVYCSNPLTMSGKSDELSTQTWIDVFQQAAAMGVLQVDLSGGEPAARVDLVELVSAARESGLYVNLITSGIGLSGEKLEQLAHARLDHVQLSFQDSDSGPADEIAGATAHAKKLEIAREIQPYRMGFTVNIVVHRHNLQRLPQMIALAEELGANKLEVAHVQYYGWAFRNRESLLPTREQLDSSLEVIQAAQARLEGRMRIDYVVPDYYAKFPKACMGGWGRKTMLITPSGEALPCHAAKIIPEMRFENVKEQKLHWVWQESDSFRRFRGEAWMPEPCRSCDRRTRDFGGCRCQAFLLTGDSYATDPVCSLAPAHQGVEEIVQRVNARHSSAREVPESKSAKHVAWKYRQNAH